MNFLKYFLKVLFFLLVFNLKASSDIIEKINIEGNQRISSNTIILFTEVNIGQEITDKDLNPILNNLYNTSYFNDVRISLKNNILNIFVEEFPIIQKINYNGVKSNTILEKITEGKLLKDKSPYIKFSLNNEKERLLSQIKELGYYNASIETTQETLDENLVNINFDIKLGDKSKIKKISFIGNKVFKDNRLKRLIASSEYKFWKIISGRKYLNENLVKLDERLLKNYYLNNGYYDVKIYSSFAKLIKENEFELIFNIDSNQQYYFGDIKLDLPPDFDEKNFLKLEKLFSDIKGEVYSINQIEKILDEIDLITLQEQYQFINASVEENLLSNNINLIFKIKESDKYYVEKINIYGNNVTQENVIRNQLELDEGDPFNEILLNKSINNLKSLNFFKNVDKSVKEGSSKKHKNFKFIC
jgi:outer membrane protein insertion porin family